MKVEGRLKADWQAKAPAPQKPANPDGYRKSGIESL